MIGSATSVADFMGQMGRLNPTAISIADPRQRGGLSDEVVRMRDSVAGDISQSKVAQNIASQSGRLLDVKA